MLLFVVVKAVHKARFLHTNIKKFVFSIHVHVKVHVCCMTEPLRIIIGEILFTLGKEQQIYCLSTVDRCRMFIEVYNLNESD